MTDSPTFTIDLDVDPDSPEWVELPRLEALQRLENMLTEDVIAFEIDYVEDDTPVGRLQSYVWLRVTDDDDQLPVLLALRDPIKSHAPLRWFLHRDLVDD